MKSYLPSSDTLLIAIRAKCLECSGGNRQTVERCLIKGCAIYPYRSVKAVGDEHERNIKIDGQIDVYDVLMTR